MLTEQSPDVETAELNAAVEVARVAAGPHLPLSLARRSSLRVALARIAVAIIVVCCTAWGYYFGRLSVQSANDLIDAGFTIVDPEGCEVANFDDGLPAIADYYADVILAEREDNPFLTADER
jgi:hypothetical protein